MHGLDSNHAQCAMDASTHVSGAGAALPQTPGDGTRAPWGLVVPKAVARSRAWEMMSRRKQRRRVKARALSRCRRTGPSAPSGPRHRRAGAKPPVRHSHSHPPTRKPPLISHCVRAKRCKATPVVERHHRADPRSLVFPTEIQTGLHFFPSITAASTSAMAPMAPPSPDTNSPSPPPPASVAKLPRSVLSIAAFQLPP